MTAHIITRREEADYAESYPGEPPEFEDHLECPVGCSGWQECREYKHAVPGYEGENSGPWESDEDAPWYDEEEFEFHGVLHTWNGYGYGWTVPYEGCVVGGNDWSEPYGIPDREGKWLVDDDWDDTTVSLSAVCELDYVRLGISYRIEPSALITASNERVPAEFLSAVRDEAPVDAHA